MLKFKYIARDKDGKLVSGIAEHADQDDAVAAIQSRGLIVISISVDKKKAAARPGLKRLRRGLRQDDLAGFCRQMATLLNAGVTLLRSLSILSRETNSRPLSNAIDKIRMEDMADLLAKVHQGFTLQLTLNNQVD